MKKFLFIIGVCCAFTLVGCTKLNVEDDPKIIEEEEETGTEITVDELYERAANFAEQDYKTISYVSNSVSTENVTTSGVTTNTNDTYKYLIDVKTSGDYYLYTSKETLETFAEEELIAQEDSYKYLMSSNGSVSEVTLSTETSESLILEMFETFIKTSVMTESMIKIYLFYYEVDSITVDGEDNITLSLKMDALNYLSTVLLRNNELNIDATGTLYAKIVLNKYGYILATEQTCEDFTYTVEGDVTTYFMEVDSTVTASYDEEIDKTQKIIVS